LKNIKESAQDKKRISLRTSRKESTIQGRTKEDEFKQKKDEL